MLVSGGGGGTREPVALLRLDVAGQSTVLIAIPVRWASPFWISPSSLDVSSWDLLPQAAANRARQASVASSGFIASSRPGNLSGGCSAGCQRRRLRLRLADSLPPCSGSSGVRTAGPTASTSPFGVVVRRPSSSAPPIASRAFGQGTGSPAFHAG